MQFAKLKYAIIGLSLITVLATCKKKDGVPPEITIQLPNENQIYAVYDTVITRVSVHDDQGLEYVQVQIVDADFISTGPSVPVNVSANNPVALAELVISNKLLTTGDYYVLVTASDGENESREFRKIRIIELPKKRRGVYASVASDPAQIWKVDSQLQTVSAWLTPAQDVRKLVVNSEVDKLSFVGQLSTGIQTIDIQSGAVLWSDDVPSVNQIQRFTELTIFANSLWVGLYDKELRSYSSTGSLLMNEQTGNYRPETIFTDENYLVVEMNLIGDASHHIFVYNRQTRVLLWQQEIPMDVVAICHLQNDEVLLFGNDGLQARVLHYDVGDNGWWEPRQLPSGQLFDATNTTGLKFAIAHQNGVYSYTYSPNFLNLITPTTVAQDLCFDLDNGTLLAASGNAILELETTGGQVLNTVVLADSISSLDIHYTR